MCDSYNIGTIDQFYGNIPVIEISDVSKIISEMIRIKNDISRDVTKKFRPYDIDEKTNLNCLSKNLCEKIKKYHLDVYDVIDDAINCQEELEASIRSDLYDYYWEVYMDVLISLGIDFDDHDMVKVESDKIYTEMINKIDDQLFSGKQTSIETDKKYTYLNAITAYVFYKCKFLIPFEGSSRLV